MHSVLYVIHNIALSRYNHMNDFDKAIIIKVAKIIPNLALSE